MEHRVLRLTVRWQEPGYKQCCRTRGIQEIVQRSHATRAGRHDEIVSKNRFFAGIAYAVLAKPRVRKYIIAVASAEWDPEDFEEFGSDLLGATWTLEVVEVSKIKVRPELMRSRKFLADLRPRIEAVSRRIAQGMPIPPLVLRGKDYLHLRRVCTASRAKGQGITKCLAYVGR